jgi:hypothetical protein
MTFVFSRCKLALMVVVGALTCSESIRADDTNDLVVLVHPALKGWADAASLNPDFKDSFSHSFFGSYDLKKKSIVAEKLPNRIEVGNSTKAVKEWSMLIQYGEPKTAKGPKGFYVFIPWTIYFRDTDAKVTEIAKGVRQFRSANEYLKRPQDLQVRLSFAAESSRVFADKVEIKRIPNLINRFDGSFETSASAPAKLEMKGGPRTGSIRLHNKFPVPVALTFKITSLAGERYLTVPGKFDTGEWMPPLVLEAGEKKTLTVDLKDFPMGQEPVNWSIQNLVFLQTKNAPMK